jgi:translation initiation factor IF-3
VNDRIRVPEVRVIYGEHNLVIATHKALEKAKTLGLDLVEVAPNVRPPVCRIVDFGKWKYEQSKLKKNEKPKSREKEVKFRVNIDPHDYSIKMTRGEDFLCSGHKVRVQLQFRGRQMAHKDLGFDLMNRVKVDLKGVAHIDLEPKLNARNILMMLSPLPPQQQIRKYRAEDEEHDIDLDAHEAAEAAEAEAHDAEDEDELHEDENDEGAEEEATSEDGAASESAPEVEAGSEEDESPKAEVEAGSEEAEDESPKAEADPAKEADSEEE